VRINREKESGTKTRENRVEGKKGKKWEGGCREEKRLSILIAMMMQMMQMMMMMMMTMMMMMIQRNKTAQFLGNTAATTKRGWRTWKKRWESEIQRGNKAAEIACSCTHTGLHFF